MNSTSTSAGSPATAVPPRTSKGQLIALVLSWTAVSLPLAWGVLETLRKALALFQ